MKRRILALSLLGTTVAIAAISGHATYTGKWVGSTCAAE